MLVNVSRFTGVQRQVRNEVHHTLDQIQVSARIFGELPPFKALTDLGIAGLHDVWQEEYAEVGVDWDTVQRHLHSASAPIRVVEVNSGSAGTLNYSDYPNGLNLIAVGGFSLSRGLTLEGLVVSYFMRNSIMYDTLMQMGRWFGYRPDYDDLCRVWMLEEAQGWYEHITDSIELLRDDLRSMEAAGATPEQFGLKVRAHPDTLIVTARNKMKSTETVSIEVGLGEKFIETATLRRDVQSLEANRLALRRMVDDLSHRGFSVKGAQSESRGWLLSGIPVEPVLNFLLEFQHHPRSLTTEPGPVRQYIGDRSQNELKVWDVLFASLRNEDAPAGIDNSLGIRINRQRRSEGKRSDSKTLLVTSKQRVASRGVEQTGLTPAEVEEAQRAYREDPRNRVRMELGSEQISYPDYIYRKLRRRPLLIHPSSCNRRRSSRGRGFERSRLDCRLEHQFPQNEHPRATGALCGWNRVAQGKLRGGS